MKQLFALICSVFFFSNGAVVKASGTDTLAHALLWKVTGKNLQKPSYLFGTYHLMTHEFSKTVKGLNKAFKKSNIVVGEIVMNSELSSQLMPYMVLKNGTLDSLLGKERFDSLDKALKSRAGLSAMILNKLKPTAVYTIFVTTELKKSGLLESGNGSPMDVYFQDHAREKKKEVKGLETVEEQAAILFGTTSLERQCDLLMDYVRKGGAESHEQNKKMKECYTAQNLNCLSGMMSSSEFSDAETTDLLDKRNNAWVPQLEKWMPDNSLFVAVGALHLTGETGLITQLRKRGYTVEPVSTTR